MYEPSQQIQDQTRFLLGFGVATFGSANLAHGAGMLYATNHENLSALIFLSSLIPHTTIGYLAIKHRTTHSPSFETSNEAVGDADPLDQTRPVATRRGGSPTRGRESQPEHDIETNARTLLGEQKYTELTAPVSIWKRIRNAADFLVGDDDPKVLIGSWIAVAVIAVAVFA